MKNLTRTVSESEAMKRKWEKRIMQEKNYSENTAKWMAQHLEALLDYMQYGHAVIAFYKQNVEAAVVYWDIDEQGWRTFQMENFLEWRVMG